MSLIHARRCNAQAKGSGQQCRNPAIRDSKKCRSHGGKTPKGMESPNFKHGLYSKYLSKTLRQHFEELAEIEGLFDLREEVLLLTVRNQDLLNQLTDSVSIEKANAIWSKIDATIERKRKLIQTTTSLEILKKNHVPASSVIQAFQQIADAITEVLRYEPTLLKQLHLRLIQISGLNFEEESATKLIN